MIIRRLAARGFRSWEKIDLQLSEEVTVLVGPNGSGKTNLLEAVHFAVSGRSFRTSNDRQMVGTGSDVARAEVTVSTAHGDQVFASALGRTGSKVQTTNGSPVESGDIMNPRPLVTVFAPDRISLVTGAPSERRAYMDNLAASIDPTVASLRGDYNKALIQRNALLGRIKAGSSKPATLDAWDREVARTGALLSACRSEAVDSISGVAAGIADGLGLSGRFEISHRSASGSDAAELLGKLAENRLTDIDRGFGTVGPHRDDLRIRREGRELKSHGSQGEKRLGVLAVLLAEREVIGIRRGAPPVLMLDDVMSELDAERRLRLTGLISGSGQALITATEVSHVPVGISAKATVLEIGAHDATRVRAA